MTASTAITPFNFNSAEIRLIVRSGEPWFITADVARVLGYRDANNAGRVLDDDEKDTHVVSTPGGDQKLTVINESGLYALVLRSRKPEARKFAKWVTSEVLPAIRKTGKYERPAIPYSVQPGDALHKAEADELRTMLETAAQKLPKEKRGTFLQSGWAKLRAHTGVNYRQIPKAAVTDALSLLARHVADWELVDEAPPAGTVNELVAEWVKKIEAPNGYPAALFEPIIEAVRRKQGKQLAQPSPSSINAADGPALVAARKVAMDYFNAMHTTKAEGKTSARTGEIPQEVLGGMIADAVLRQRMLVSFDYVTGRMQTKMVPADSSIISLESGDYTALVQRIPMQRLSELADALNKRVACHLGAFNQRLQSDAPALQLHS